MKVVACDISSEMQPFACLNVGCDAAIVEVDVSGTVGRSQMGAAIPYPWLELRCANNHITEVQGALSYKVTP